MRSHESDIKYLDLKFDSGNYPIFIAFDIEHITLVAHIIS